jgi:hypothetical protein
MSEETRSRVVRQLTRVAGFSDHSNTHWDPGTAITSVGPVAVSAALEVVAAETPDEVDRSSGLPAKACPAATVSVAETTKTPAHGSNHLPTCFAIPGKTLARSAEWNQCICPVLLPQHVNVVLMGQVLAGWDRTNTHDAHN